MQAENFQETALRWHLQVASNRMSSFRDKDDDFLQDDGQGDLFANNLEHGNKPP
jgi:hypothetical protein